MDFPRKTTTCDDDDAEDPLAASPGERSSREEEEEEEEEEDDVVAEEDSRYDVISVGDIPFSCVCVCVFLVSNGEDGQTIWGFGIGVVDSDLGIEPG